MRPTEKILAQVGQEVLEDRAFLFVIPGMEKAGVRSEGTEVASAVVPYQGPFSGCLRMSVPLEVLEELAENMLRLEDEPPAVSSQEKRQALGTVARAISGSVLGAMAGPEPVFKLSDPRIEIGFEGKMALDPPGDASTVRLPLNAGWVELTLVREPVPV
jgi:hypothetical protein